jgi:hypothetical protein
MTGRIAGAIPELLIEAVQDGNAAGVKALLQIGADFNEQDEQGRSALMLAACHGYTEIARLLLAEGADANGCRSNGMTPLMYAANGNHAETARLLVESGADVNAADDSNWTALHHAAQFTDGAEIMRLLIERGARTGVMTTDGDTAMSIAQARNCGNHGETVQLLKDAQEGRFPLPAVSSPDIDTGEYHATAVQRQQMLKARAPKPNIIRGGARP